MTPSEEKQPEQKPLGGWLGVGAARLREQQASHEKYASVGSTMGSVHHQLQKSENRLLHALCYSDTARCTPHLQDRHVKVRHESSVGPGMPPTLQLWCHG